MLFSNCFEHMKMHRGGWGLTPFPLKNGDQRYALIHNNTSATSSNSKDEVKLNRLRTGVGRFHSSMHKWGLAPSPNCECGAEQTADRVLTACPIHRAPHGARGLTIFG